MRFGDGARAHDARRVDGAVDDRGGDAAFVAVAVISHDHADASGEAGVERVEGPRRFKPEMFADVVASGSRPPR